MTSSNSSSVVIPGDEGLYPEPLSWWTVRMGDHTFRLKAREYEHAVVWVEVWCHENGIERRGAEFVKDRA